MKKETSNTEVQLNGINNTDSRDQSVNIYNNCTFYGNSAKKPQEESGKQDPRWKNIILRFFSSFYYLLKLFINNKE